MDKTFGNYIGYKQKHDFLRAKSAKPGSKTLSHHFDHLLTKKYGENIDKKQMVEMYIKDRHK
jgi:hypothetical protein